MGFNTASMTPAEIAVHTKILADIAAGVDPFGEEDLDEQDTDIPADDAVPVNTNAEVEATDPPAEAEPAAAAVVEPVVAEAEPAAAEPVAAEAVVPEDFGVAPDLSDLKGLVLPEVPPVDVAAAEGKISELQAKIDEIEAKFEDGTLSPAERNAQARPLESEIRATERNLAVSLGRQAAAIDHAQATSEQVLGRLRAAAARDGLDYGKPGQEPTPHARQFDLASQKFYANPKYANSKTWVEIAALADADVRRDNGIAPKAAAAPAPAAKPAVAAPVTAKAPAAAPRAKPAAPPQTLRDLPAAARASDASETIAGKLMAANAHGKDAIWNKMTKAQQAAALGEE